MSFLRAARAALAGQNCLPQILVAVVAVVVLAGLSLSCVSSSHSTAGPNHNAYITLPSRGSVLLLHINGATGAITLGAETPQVQNTSPTGIALLPSKKFLYGVKKLFRRKQRNAGGRGVLHLRRFRPKGDGAGCAVDVQQKHRAPRWQSDVSIMVRPRRAMTAADTGKGKSGQNDDSDDGHKNLGKTILTCQCGARRPQKAHLRTCSSISKVRTKKSCSLSCTRRRELATARLARQCPNLRRPRRKPSANPFGLDAQSWSRGIACPDRTPKAPVPTGPTPPPTPTEQ